MFAANEGSTKTMQLLIDAGADVDAKSDGGACAALLAKRNHKSKAVDMLRNNGADVSMLAGEFDFTDFLKVAALVVGVTVAVIAIANTVQTVAVSDGGYESTSPAATASSSSSSHSSGTTSSSPSSSNVGTNSSTVSSSSPVHDNTVHYTGKTCYLEIHNASKDYDGYHANCVITGVVIQDTQNGNHTLYSNKNLNIKSPKGHAVTSQTVQFNTNELHKTNKIKVTVYITTEKGSKISKSIFLNIPSDTITHRGVWWEGITLH